jgi:UDP-N-acetylglucosamine--N-acetylmuramyl-(pentapeptide) pyrophosphoryl-undecaprenol N-acetylglucosamine transferase
MSLRVLIACGGTGGHLFPGIAVAEALRQDGHEALALVSEKKVDATAMEGHPEIPFRTLPAIATPRLLSPQIVPFAFRLVKGILRARAVMKEFKPDAVLGMGGFTSFPVLVAARMAGLPSFVHESNAFPGKANRFSAKFANKVLLGFGSCARHFAGAETVEVGTPVRDGVEVASTPEEARVHFGLEPDRPTVVVIGGSQGGKGINAMVLGAIASYAARAGGVVPQFLHLTGASDHDRVVEESKKISGRVVHKALPFCHEMGMAYRAADVAVARSGASTLNELALLGLPAVLVPYPFAADRHQHLNAEAFVEAGASVMADEDKVDGAGLAEILDTLLSPPADGGRCREMAQAMLGLSPASSAEKIAKLLVEAGAR